MRLFILLSLFVLVSMTFAQPVSRLEIMPSNVSMEAGRSLQFSLLAYTPQGYVFTPQGASWTANGGNVDSQGLYTAGGYAGYQRITASYYGMSATATVQIRQASPSVARIVITPDNSQIYANNAVHFGATAYDNYNRVISCSFTWSANGGTINQNGFFRAGYASGDYQVWARDSASGVQGTANVRILGGGSPMPPNPPGPHPGPNPTPYPSAAQIIITDFDTGGNFFKPTVKITAQTIGQNIQTLRLFAIMNHGGQNELDAQACSSGATVRLRGEYDAFATRYFEIRLFNNYNQEVARERRNIH